MVDTFIESVESGTVALNDDDLIRECLMLINNNGKIEAAPGNHDDMVMACAIGLQMLKDQKALTIYDDIEKRILI
jgi:hypothetical protein